MRADEFVASRREDWNNLENLIARGSSGRLNPLRPGEVLALAALYRRATADLARAQRDWPGEPVHRYLNGLVARGHGVVYRRGGDVWRRIRDFEGTEGWVHERMLDGKRDIVVTGAVRPLRRQPVANAAVVARAEPGVVARLLECQGPWCRVDAGEATGWLRRDEVWGVLPDETVE